MKSIRELIEELNATYETVKASTDLRALKRQDLLGSKGKGRSTYYIAGKLLLEILYPGDNLIVDNHDVNQYLSSQSAPPPELKNEVPDDIKNLLHKLGKKSDTEKVNEVIIRLCQWRELSSAEIANILGKSEKHVLRKYISPLRLNEKIKYTIPDMENHPNQAYNA